MTNLIGLPATSTTRLSTGRSYGSRWSTLERSVRGRGPPKTGIVCGLGNESKEERGRSRLVWKKIPREEAQSGGPGRLARCRAARRLRRGEARRREAALRR